jgi:hypothetical protein
MVRGARIALILSLCLFGMQRAPGTTWYVDTSVPSPGDGASWEEAFLTIRDSVAFAGDSDSVPVGSDGVETSIGRRGPVSSVQRPWEIGSYR